MSQTCELHCIFIFINCVFTPAYFWIATLLHYAYFGLLQNQRASWYSCFMRFLCILSLLESLEYEFGDYGVTAFYIYYSLWALVRLSFFLFFVASFKNKFWNKHLSWFMLWKLKLWIIMFNLLKEKKLFPSVHWFNFLNNKSDVRRNKFSWT